MGPHNTLHHTLHVLETGLTFIWQHTHTHIYWIHLTSGVILLLFSARDETEQELSGLRWVWIGSLCPYPVNIIFLKGKPGRGKASEPFTIPFRCSLLFQFTSCNWMHSAIPYQAGWEQSDGQSASSCFPGPAELVLQRQGTAQPLFNLCLLKHSENPQSWFGRWVAQQQHWAKP